MTKEELKKQRKEKKLSQQELADLVGNRRGAIISWEKGSVIPSPKIKFLEKLFTKDSATLKRMLEDDKSDNLDEQEVIKYVVKNFDALMNNKDFSNKIYLEAYTIAEEMLEKKKKEALQKGD